jgi:hypothetical protein
MDSVPHSDIVANDTVNVVKAIFHWEEEHVGKTGTIVRWELPGPVMIFVETGDSRQREYRLADGTCEKV